MKYAESFISTSSLLRLPRLLCLPLVAICLLSSPAEAAVVLTPAAELPDCVMDFQEPSRATVEAGCRLAQSERPRRIADPLAGDIDALIDATAALATARQSRLEFDRWSWFGACYAATDQVAYGMYTLCRLSEAGHELLT